MSAITFFLNIDVKNTYLQQSHKTSGRDEGWLFRGSSSYFHNISITDSKNSPIFIPYPNKSYKYSIYPCNIYFLFLFAAREVMTGKRLTAAAQKARNILFMHS